MTKGYSTKKALVVAGLAIVLSLSMLVGTTFAWFTDSVTSATNIIKTGTLDVTMEWKDATAYGAQQEWKDASTGAIFNNDKWEPGYIEAKNVKIGNVGSLALKYQFAITATVTTDVTTELADAIEVYYAEGEFTLADRDLSALTYIGTLTEVLNGVPSTANGDLLAGETDTVTFALVMPEETGNEYQNKSIGTSFAVCCMATQLAYEPDSFDDQYDAAAPVDGAVAP